MPTQDNGPAMPIPPGEARPRLEIYLRLDSEGPNDTVAGALAQLGPPSASAPSAASGPRVAGYARPEVIPFLAPPDQFRKPPMETFLVLPNAARKTPRADTRKSKAPGHRLRESTKHERVTTYDAFGHLVCTCDKVCVCVPVCTCNTIPVCSCVSYNPPGRSGTSYCLCVPVCRCVPVAH